MSRYRPHKHLIRHALGLAACAAALSALVFSTAGPTRGGLASSSLIADIWVEHLPIESALGLLENDFMVLDTRGVVLWRAQPEDVHFDIAGDVVRLTVDIPAGVFGEPGHTIAWRCDARRGESPAAFWMQSMTVVAYDGFEYGGYVPSRPITGYVGEAQYRQ